MGPIESSFRETASAVKERLYGYKSEDRVKALEEEIASLNRQILVLKAHLSAAKGVARGGVAREAVNRIIDMVCREEGISRIDIVSHRRTLKVVPSRHICFYLAATQTIASLSLIGEMFNKRDHTSVLYAREKLRDLRKTDKDLDHKLSTYEAEIASFHGP